MQRDGRRVLWSNGSESIAKLDAETFEVLASFPLIAEPRFTEAEAATELDRVYDAPDSKQADLAFKLRMRMLKTNSGAGVYAMIDKDGNFYVSSQTGITVYGDAVPGDSRSPIVIRHQWTRPPDVGGALMGMNLTYDGQVILVSTAGDVIALNRDLTRMQRIKMRHSEDGPAYMERVRERTGGENGMGWVRNSFAVDPNGGIYIVSAGYMHKVAWTGQKLSTDEADGAWSEPYRDSRGLGSGSTPVLMGFGPNDDRLVVFTDGDHVMNVTAYWRDALPQGWSPPTGAPSRRLAGFARADMGDPGKKAVQTEQATVVGDYGAIVVNNEPAALPPGLPAKGSQVMFSLLGNDPRYAPHGMQKFEWDPVSNEMKLAWTNRTISSPNAVPFISLASSLVYTIGARAGKWTLEGVDWKTGKSRFHYILPSNNFNAMGAGIQQDDNGNIVYGTPFGKARIPVKLSPGQAEH
ncbi:MAG TPA: hypothetical protein VJM34_09955 [Novosphingobium sp.]|nr:hypothetical protein [Novosphingobium sp.]